MSTQDVTRSEGPAPMPGEALINWNAHAIVGKYSPDQAAGATR
jgi:hypothetical protein